MAAEGSWQQLEDGKWYYGDVKGRLKPYDELSRRSRGHFAPESPNTKHSQGKGSQFNDNKQYETGSYRSNHDSSVHPHAYSGHSQRQGTAARSTGSQLRSPACATGYSKASTFREHRKLDRVPGHAVTPKLGSYSGRLEHRARDDRSKNLGHSQSRTYDQPQKPHSHQKYEDYPKQSMRRASISKGIGYINNQWL